MAIDNQTFFSWDRHKIQEYRIIQQSEWYHTKQENIWRPVTKQADRLCGIFWPEHFRFDVMPLCTSVKFQYSGCKHYVSCPTKLYIGKRMAATMPPATMARTTISTGSMAVEMLRISSSSSSS